MNHLRTQPSFPDQAQSRLIKANQVIFCTGLTLNPLLQYSTTPLDFSHFAVENQPQFEQLCAPKTFMNWPCSSRGCETEFFAFLVGQSCCSALKSWAARQRRPTKDVKIFVVRPPAVAHPKRASEKSLTD